jgi:hypothetical protein
VVLNCCRHRHERNAASLEDLGDLGEIVQRAGQAVDLIGDHHIDLALTDVG